MRLVQPTMLQLLTLTAQARPDEIEQHKALIGREWSVDDVANDHYNRIGVKFCLTTDDGQPVAAGGWDPIIEGVWQSWMVGTMEQWERYWRSITKASLRVMDRLEQSGARRLQTCALASRAAACQWYVKGLKMQPEGVMRGFGMNGEDVAMFARVKEGANG